MTATVTLTATRAPRCEPGLPFEPLRSRIEARLGPHGVLVSLGDADRQAYYRAARSGVITVWAADRLCVDVLGLHPAAVYGATWWEKS